MTFANETVLQKNLTQLTDLKINFDESNGKLILGQGTTTDMSLDGAKLEIELVRDIKREW